MAEELEDDAIVDCWEDFEENPGALEEHLKKMSVKDDKEQKQCENIIVTDEDCKSMGLSPQEPKIMILRRPTQSDEVAPNGVVVQKPKLPVKTLQQRQAAYAEARLRILGGTGPSEESKLNAPQQKSSEVSDSATVSENVPTSCNQSETPDVPSTSYNIQDTESCSKPIAMVKPSTSNVTVGLQDQPSVPQCEFQQSTRSSGPS